MNWQCFFMFHEWDGCTCKKCSGRRDLQHIWIASQRGRLDRTSDLGVETLNKGRISCTRCGRDVELSNQAHYTELKQQGFRIEHIRKEYLRSTRDDCTAYECYGACGACQRGYYEATFAEDTALIFQDRELVAEFKRTYQSTF